MMQSQLIQRPGLPAAANDPMGMPTMSSREIAQLTGKEHKNVLADIRRMLSELGKGSAEFSALRNSVWKPA